MSMGTVVHIVDAASAERRLLGAILPVTGETWFFKLVGPKDVVAANREAFTTYLGGVKVGAPQRPLSPEEMEPIPERPTLTYQAPESWVEGEGSMMRAASFSVADEDGGEADIAVIPLGGSGGTRLANINQWRATLRLEAATEKDVPGLIETLDVGGREFQLADLESAEAMTDAGNKARILVAFVKAEGYTWFFKIGGDSGLVAAQKPALIEFLRSVKFDAAK